MMKKMREYTKVILWIVIVAFIGTIIFAWGSGGLKRGRDPNTVAKIDGIKVSRQYYENAYRDEYDKALQEAPDHELTDEASKQLQETVWQRVVGEVILGQQMDKLKIEVSDRELVDFMKRSPLPEIQNNEAFQTDGHFDYNKYVNLMYNPEVNWLPLENYVRNRLAIMKLQTLAIAPVYVSEDDVQIEFEDKGIQISVEYVLFKPYVQPGSSAASDDELMKYFEEHKDEFGFAQKEEKVVLTMASFFPYMRPEINDSMINLLGAIRKRVMAGEDFAALANQYTQDAPGSGGALPWTRQGGFVPEFEEKVLAMKPGEFTEPFRSRFGFHIARLDSLRDTTDPQGKTVKEMKASHILMRVEPEPDEEGKVEFEATLKELSEINGVEKFKKRATELGARVYETEPLGKSARIQELQTDAAKMIQWALSQEVGKVSGLFTTRGGYVIGAVTKKIAAEMPPFSEIKDLVNSKYQSAKQLNELEVKAKQFRAEIANPMDFKTIAARWGLEVGEQLDFPRQKFLGGGIPGQPLFKAAAFQLTMGNPVSKPIRTEAGFYVIHLLNRTAFDQTMYAAEHDSVSKALQSDKQQKLFQSWYQGLVEGANIEDYRTGEERQEGS